MALSRTLQMDSVRSWPSALARFNASMVSSVSPDCEMVTINWRGLGMESR